MKTDPHAPHLLGQKAAREHLLALEKLAKSLGIVGYKRAVFTSSGSEAIAQVHFSIYIHSVRALGKTHFVLAESAGRPFFDSVSRLEGLGVCGKTAPMTKNGPLDLERFEEILSPRTALVSLSIAHPLLGFIEPIEEIAALCHKHGVPLHLDVTAGLGKMWLDLEAIGADYITFNGPKPGLGALWIADEALIESLIPGSDEQNGLRAGHIDPEACSHLAEYIENQICGLHTFSMEMAEKKAAFVEQLVGAQIYSPEESLPDTLAFGFEEIHGELLSYHLSEKGYLPSFGGGIEQPLENLVRKMGFDHPQTVLSLSSMDCADEIIGIAGDLKS